MKLVNVEMEESVLGSCLIDPGAIRRIGFLQPGDFKIRKNEWVWNAMLALHDRHESIDILTLCDEIGPRLKSLGGAAYLTGLMNVVPSALHVETYANKVVGLSTRRRLISEASELAKAAHDLDKLPNETISETCSSLSGITRARGEFESARSVANRVWTQVVEWQDDPVEDGVRGIRTGLRELDRVTGGLQESELVIVASRPAVGKTAVVAWIALQCALAGVSVILCSLEMSSEQILSRMACGLSHTRSQDLKCGSVPERQFYKYSTAMQQIRDLDCLRISDKTNITVPALRAAAAGLEYPRIVIVDHIRLMGDKADNEVLRLGQITWGLKQLAKEGHCTVVACAQLSRRSEYRADKKPTMADIRDSGQIEEDADHVWGLWRAKEMLTMEIITLKNRSGPADHICEISFDPSCMRLGDLL